MITLAENIARLRALPDDWAGAYRTEKPTKEAIDRAEAFIALAVEMGCPPFLVCASGDHGAAVCWAKWGMYADIEFSNDGEASAITKVLDSDHLGDIWEVDPLNPDELKAAITRIKTFLETKVTP